MQHRKLVEISNMQKKEEKKKKKETTQYICITISSWSV